MVLFLAFSLTPAGVALWAAICLMAAVMALLTGPPTFGLVAVVVLSGLDLVLVRPAQASRAGAVQLESDHGLVSFPDLILALNSAADSRIAKSILDALAWQAQKKRRTPGTSVFLHPS